MQEQELHCPICDALVTGRRHAPFCSARCQLIDLGNWLGERYVVPTAAPAAPDRDAPPEDPGASDEDSDFPHSKSSR